MLAGMISSLLLPGPRSSPGPSRPWRIGTRPGPGRCPGRAQKYRPRARSPCDGGCPEERREQSWLSTPSQRREAFDSAPGGKIGASVGRGLGHPGAPPRPPALSMGPAPPCSIRRIPAALRPRRSALGPPERPRRAAPRRAPPRPSGHSPAPPPPPCARPARPSANSGPGLSRSRGPEGRGPRPRPPNQEPPSDARGQSAPCRPSPGGSDGNIPEGSLRLAPLSPTTPPRRSAVDLPTPPKAVAGCTTAGRGGGNLRLGPCQSRGGRRRATNGKLGPLDHVLLADCRSGVSGMVRGGRAGRGSQVTGAKFRAEANSAHPEKLTL